jgi:hypothetical protein
LLSATGLLDSAMRIPGALAASIGEMGSGTALGVTRGADGPVAAPQAYSRAAMDVCAGSGLLAGRDQVFEESVLTGAQTYFVLRVVPLHSGAGPAFLYMALDRSQTNLALARMDIKTIGDRIPPVIEMHGLGAATVPSPGTPPTGMHLPRREPAPTPATAEPPATLTDESLLHRLLAALRRLE